MELTCDKQRLWRWRCEIGLSAKFAFLEVLELAPHSGKPQTISIGRILWLPHSPKRQRGDGWASKTRPRADAWGYVEIVAARNEDNQKFRYDAYKGLRFFVRLRRGEGAPAGQYNTRKTNRFQQPLKVFVDV